MESIEKKLMEGNITRLKQELVEIERKKEDALDLVGELSHSLGSFYSNIESLREQAEDLSAEVQSDMDHAYSLAQQLGDAEGELDDIRDRYRTTVPSQSRRYIPGRMGRRTTRRSS